MVDESERKEETEIQNMSFEKYKRNIKLILIVGGIVVLILGPTFFVFSPLFVGSSIEQINESLTKASVWDEGNDIFQNADFALDLDVNFISISDKQQFTLKAEMRVPFINENKEITSHDIVNYDFQFYSGSGYKIQSDNFFADFKETIQWGSRGKFYYLPLDYYNFYLLFPNLNNISINQKDQLFVSLKCTNSNWQFYNFEVEFSESQLIIFFSINRMPLVIFSEVLIPLIILTGLFITNYIANPLIKLNNKDENNGREADKKTNYIKEEIALRRKFRVDTAKWLLAFSFVNILFNESIFIPYSVKSALAVITLFIVTGYYITSIYQGQYKCALWNYAMAISSIIVVITTVLYFTLFLIVFSFLNYW